VRKQVAKPATVYPIPTENASEIGKCTRQHHNRTETEDDKPVNSYHQFRPTVSTRCYNDGTENEGVSFNHPDYGQKPLIDVKKS
jgi:hypothetical protein